MDEKEEGEISLDDVSSSEDGQSYGYSMSQCPSTRSSGAKNLMKRDPVHGKENRRHVSDTIPLIKYPMATLHEKNDDRLILSSDEDLEIVCVPGSSRQVVLPCVKKRHKKKKKKKPTSGTNFNFSIDDFVSVADNDQVIVNNIEAQRLLSRRKRTPSPVYKRKRSPSSRKKDYQRSIKNHRSQLRHKSPMQFSRSPSPKRRSPRHTRSPRQSPLPLSISSLTISTTKAHDVALLYHKNKDVLNHVPDNYDELYATSLLKKVKHLDAVGTLLQSSSQKQKDAPSLKDKLNNMMKLHTELSEVIEVKIKDKKGENSNEIETEEEEDLDLLRRQALETKHQKSDIADTQNYVNTEKNIASTERNQSDYQNDIDDNDEEDLELRMIALRSAVMNKYQNRVKKSGTKKSKMPKRDESPFNDSFFNQDLINDDSEIGSVASSLTWSPTLHSQQAEDMELDSDVEREKEDIFSSPYSPTDDVMPLNHLDTDNNHKTTKTLFNKKSKIHDDEKVFDSNTIITPRYEVSTSDLAKTPWVNKLDESSANNLSSPELSKNNHRYKETTNKVNPEIPYSPTDPLFSISCDLEIPVSPPELLPNLVNISSPSPNLEVLKSNKISYCIPYRPNLVQIPLEQDPVQLIPPEILREISLPADDFPIIVEKICDFQNEKEILISIDEKHDQNINLSDSITSNIIQEKHTVDEPLYLQGIPDITKDINKIPTSFDKSLVPITILKTNKKLQLLPKKKLDQIPEPTFITAEMQSVNVVTEQIHQSNAIFKPIKLQPVSKKSTIIATPAAAFDIYSNDDGSFGDIPNDNLTQKSDNTNGDNNDSDVMVDSIVENVSQTSENMDHNIQRKKKKKIGNSLRKISHLNDNMVTILDKNNEENTKSDYEYVKIRKDEDKNSQHKEKHEDIKKHLEKREKQLREKLDIKKQERPKSDHRSQKQEKYSKLSSKNDTNFKNLEDNLAVKNVFNNGTSEIMQVINNKNEEKRVEDKRRKSSMEDDEDELRALLLASISKRPRNLDSSVPIVKVSKLPVEESQDIETKLSENNTTKIKNLVGSLEKNVSSTTRVAFPPKKIVPLSANPSPIVLTNVIKVFDNNMEKQVALMPENPEIEKPMSAVTVTNALKTNVKKVVLPTIATKVGNNIVKKNPTLNTTIQNFNVRNVNPTRNKTVNNIKINENFRPPSPKVSSLKNCRLIINLEEDSNSDTESESSNANLHSEQNNTASKPKDCLTIPTTDFEKSVETFLRDQRKKLESVAVTIEPKETKISTPKSKVLVEKKSSKITSTTPLAVQHLSASRQEEYRRLKQQILDRETKRLEKSIIKLKSLSHKINNCSSSSTITRALSPASLIDELNKSSPVKIHNRHNVETETSTDCEPNPSNIVLQSTEKLAIEMSTVEKERDQISNKTSKDDFSNSILEAIPKITTPLDILSKQISNGNILNKEHLMEIEKISKKKGLIKIVPVLKILTTEQLNRKFDSQNRLKKIDTIEDIKNNELTIKNMVNSKANSSEADIVLDISSKIEIPQPEKTLQLEENNTETSELGNSSITSKTLEKTSLPSVESNREQSGGHLNSTITLDDTRDDQMMNIEQPINYKSPLKETLDLGLLKSKQPAKEFSEQMKSDVMVELENLSTLSKEERNKKLSSIEKELVTNRFMVLDDLTEMSKNLKQWELERELQTELTAEIRRLRLQLKIAENRLQKQRTKITNMGPKVSKAHKTIITGRAKCLKLTKLCQGVGSNVVGSNYKVPSTGAQRMIDSLKEVVFHTRQLSQKTATGICNDVPNRKKKNPEGKITNASDSSQPINSNSETTDDVTIQSDGGALNSISNKKTTQLQNTVESVKISENTSVPIEETEPPVCSSTPRTSTCVRRESNITKTCPAVESRLTDTGQLPHNYESVLSIFNTPEHIDPNGVLCPYELMGTCSDDGCSYNHLDTNRRR